VSSPDAPESSPAQAREAALRLLARREHSARELETKLIGKGWPEGDVTEVIADLAEAGLQSDRRFAESFARQRAGRYYGPLRIRAELAQRGIDAELRAEVLEALEVDFFELAADFYRRKYGDPESDPGYRERARRSRALHRRGFESEHIRGLFPRS